MLHQGLKTSLGLGTEQYSHLAETLKHIADDCQHLHKELQLLREESCAVNPTIIGGFLNEATSCLTKSGSDVASAVTGIDAKLEGLFHHLHHNNEDIQTWIAKETKQLQEEIHQLQEETHTTHLPNAVTNSLVELSELVCNQTQIAYGIQASHE